MTQRITKQKEAFSSEKEKELIRLAQLGDFNAFELLYNQYFNGVYNRVWYLVPRQDVDDVTQETFAAAAKSLKGFKGDAKFSTWLRTLTNRQIANYYRSRNRTKSEMDVDISELEAKIVSGASHKEDSSRVDDLILLQQGLDKLPTHYREIILLRFAEGMKFRDIAENQEKSIEATKSLFRRAISSLREQMGVIHG